MSWSMLKMMCLSSVRKMRLFTRHPTLIHPNKMELLNANNHILDVARTIMFHLHLKYLWSDAVLSAYHLINRSTHLPLVEKFHSLVFILIEMFSL